MDDVSGGWSVRPINFSPSTQAAAAAPSSAPSTAADSFTIKKNYAYLAAALVAAYFFFRGA